MSVDQTTKVAARRKPLTLVAVSLGFFIVILDTTIVNVALPRIGHDLDGGVALLQWVVDSYTLVFAALLLTAGAACDILGARRVYVGGLGLFAVFSTCCALAPSGGLLIAFRALQGLGAAALVPGSLALLAASYPDRQARARAIGIWGGVGGIAAAAGPVLGGVLIAGLGWRGVFWVNLPVVAAAFWLTMTQTPRTVPHHARRVDLLGQVTATATLCLATFAVIDGAHHGWPLRDTILLGGGLACAVAFVLAERSHPDPMLPMALFSQGGFATAAFVGLALNFSFYGQLFALTLYFQHLRGFSPLTAGLALVPQAFGAVVGSPLGGRATARYGPFRTMFAGLVIGGCGFVSLALIGRHTAYSAIALLTFVAGLGMAIAMPAATAGAVASAPDRYAGIAGGVINSARQTGSVFGVAILGGLVAVGPFLPGFRAAVLVAGGVFFVAAIVTLPNVRATRA